MGQRHAGRGGAGHGSRDAGRDFSGDTGGAHDVEFLAAAAENEGIAALEAHDALTLAGLTHQDFADLVLRYRVMALGLADIDAQRVAARQRHHALGNQAVVHDDIGFAQQAGSLEGEKIGIAGTGADQVDDAAAFGAFTVQLAQHFAAGTGLVARERQIAGLAAQGAFPEGAAIVEFRQYRLHRAAQLAGEVRQRADARGQDLFHRSADIHRQDRRGTARGDGNDNTVTVDNGGGLEVGSRGAVDDINRNAQTAAGAGQRVDGNAVAAGDEKQSRATKVPPRRHAAFDPRILGDIRGNRIVRVSGEPQ